VNRASDSGANKRSLDKREAPFSKGLPTPRVPGYSSLPLFLQPNLQLAKTLFHFFGGNGGPQIFHSSADPSPPIPRVNPNRASEHRVDPNRENEHSANPCCIHDTGTNPNRVSTDRVNPDRVNPDRVNEHRENPDARAAWGYVDFAWGGFIGETRVDGGDAPFPGYLVPDVSRGTVVTIGWIACHSARHSWKPTVMSPLPA